MLVGLLSCLERRLCSGSSGEGTDLKNNHFDLFPLVKLCIWFLFEAVDGDLMGAGFKPSKAFSSLSSTVPSSPGVSMLVLGYGPTKPVQLAEPETSRTSPFTSLAPGFAVLACYGFTCGFRQMPSHTLLCPQSSPCNLAIHGPAMLWTSGFPRVQAVCVPASQFTCTEHCRLTWPLCSHYPLVYVLFIYPWYGKWSEPSRKYSLGLKRAHAEITLLVSTTLHS